jgi:hypothetical protein
MKNLVRGFLFMLILCGVAREPGAAEPRRGAESIGETRRLIALSKIKDVSYGFMTIAIENNKKRYADISEGKWREIEKVVYEEAERISGDFLDRLVDVFDRSFTREEIRQLVRFAESPLGEKYFKATPLIYQEALRIGIELEKTVTVQVRQRLEKLHQSAP